MDAQMVIAGELISGSGTRIPVKDPLTDDVVGSIPQATPEDIETALRSAEAAAAQMANTSAGERAATLERVAELVESNTADLVKLVVAEQGKTLAEADREVGRVPPLLRLCASEALRISGETVPLDQSPDGIGRLGLTLRVPVGVVVAITPFNYPTLLVAHKLGPAYAAGNSVILKPATLTPLSGLRLAQLFVEAGAPAGSMQCLTGSGRDVGMALASDDRVRAITFTGSREAGDVLTKIAGVKHLLLELGANCPMIVAADADLEQAANATTLGGFSNAGQACISVQRILVERPAYEQFLQVLAPKVESIRAGNPMESSTNMGPLISVGEAERVSAIIGETAAAGARIVSGGDRDGAVHAPTIVADVPTDSRLFSEELFGPAVGVRPVDSLDEALTIANASEYGLGAGIFTTNVHTALRFAREMEAGVIQINWSPLWRADSMPYGGLKQSGIGREGPHFAIEELTESKTVVFHPPAKEE